MLREFETFVTGSGVIAAFGEVGTPDFWIIEGEASSPRIYHALRVGARRMVDAFYGAALDAGGRDNGAPGLRPRYHPNYYYAAFILDPDGHNVEAVCHVPT